VASRSTPPIRRSFWLQYLSLFSSLGTLLCCALPSLLVLFGLGATVATVLSAAPWLVSLSRRKVWVFAVAGALVGASFFYIYAIAPRLQAGGATCPPDDPACGTAARISKVVLWVSAVIYAVGALTAFALGPFLLWWDSSH
jgi:hypothetical protein